MNVHNVMEEQVFARINALYDQVKQINPPWMTCDCEHCRMNTVSYVLNRIPPKYVVSGRGATYNLSFNDPQLRADIDTLGIEGMRLVSAAKRPYHNHKPEETAIAATGTPVYNFPTFLGAVYDGNTFEPLANAQVLLTYNNEPARMMDVTWQNPCTTFKTTRAAYTFWLKPVPAKEEHTHTVFPFSLEITAEGYEPVYYTFEVPVISEKQAKCELNSIYSLKIQDLYLFPHDSIQSSDA